MTGASADVSLKRNDSPYIGLAGLMRMIVAGVDLREVGMQLLEHSGKHPDDANALMDLSTILHIIGHHENARVTQAQALKFRQIYHIPPASGAANIRLLAIAGPGDLKVNMPVDLLLKDSDVALDILYVWPGQPASIDLNEYDVAIVAVGESDETHPLLQWIETIVALWQLPVLNAPGRVGMTSRDRACEALASAAGIVIPVTRRVERLSLEQTACKIGFPVIVRPVGSHAGQGLIKAERPADIPDYLQKMPEKEFYVSPFVDYRSPDGLFRKYRVVLIDGRPFACHMAISAHWIIHYVNAGMDRSADKRVEEAHFMASFDEQFARKHADAFQSIHERMKLDYLVIDCAETAGGELLIFETDTGGAVHAMDSADIFPYKEPQMRKVFAAFRDMLIHYSAGTPLLKTIWE